MSALRPRYCSMPSVRAAVSIPPAATLARKLANRPAVCRPATALCAAERRPPMALTERCTARRTLSRPRCPLALPDAMLPANRRTEFHVGCPPVSCAARSFEGGGVVGPGSSAAPSPCASSPGPASTWLSVGASRPSPPSAGGAHGGRSDGPPVGPGLDAEVPMLPPATRSLAHSAKPPIGRRFHRLVG